MTASRSRKKIAGMRNVIAYTLMLMIRFIQ